MVDCLWLLCCDGDGFVVLGVFLVMVESLSVLQESFNEPKNCLNLSLADVQKRHPQGRASYCCLPRDIST